MDKKTMSRIYISGKITGLDISEAVCLFDFAERELQDKFNCYLINPLKAVPFDPEKTWEEYMIRDIELLFSCDTIYMLENWKDSKGARIEHAIAIETGKTIIYQ